MILVYGLEDESREPLRDKYKMPSGFEKRVIIPESIATVGPYTADHFNNVTWRGFTEKNGKPNLSIFNETTQKRIENSKSDFSKHKKDVEDVLSPWRDSLSKEFTTDKHDQFFKELMAHSRYSPAKTSMENGNEIKEREGDKNVGKAKFQSQTRKSSKFGLEFQRKNDQNVAFMLDYPSFGSKPDNYDFQINKVKTGNRAGGLKSSERVPITTSEMRKAYRDKDERGTQPTFFAGGKKVDAPWEQKKDDWGKYGTYRLKKYEAAWEQKDPSALIEHQKKFNHLKDDNARANFLKTEWLSKGHDIPRVKDKPNLVGKSAVDLDHNKLNVSVKN